jgi:hypothetical protein
MTKKLARLLRADIQETSDLRSIAKMLADRGRGGDTLLAHITPKEVGLLKEAGGAGTVNPDTGLLEFYDWTGSGGVVSGYDGGGYTAGGDSYYDSLLAATPGVYGKDASSDYYPVAPETFAPAIDYASQSGAGASPVSDVPVVAPAAARTYANEPYEQGFVGSDALAAGISPIPQPPASDSLLKKYVGDPLKDLKTTTGLDIKDLLRIGGAGAGALIGRQQSKKAAEQVQQATQEQKNLGAPYQKTGQELQRAAMSGELTPQGAQSLQAARAQLAQGAESRGGVGVAQAQAQIEALRQNLLQNQYNLGLQVSQIGDNIALGAIRTGMQLDQQLNQANQQFYTQLAAIAGGGTYGYAPQQTRGQ